MSNFILHDMDIACFLARTRGNKCRRSGRKPSGGAGQVSLWHRAICISQRVYTLRKGQLNRHTRYTLREVS